MLCKRSNRLPSLTLCVNWPPGLLGGLLTDVLYELGCPLLSWKENHFYKNLVDVWKRLGKSDFLELIIIGLGMGEKTNIGEIF